MQGAITESLLHPTLGPKDVLNKMPKSLHAKAKAALHEIWMAETKADPEKAIDRFIETFRAKYPKAVECLIKDRDVLLTFYDFPAEHWKHIRTTNPIESTFATVRLRTHKTKGSGCRIACLTRVFKLMQSAQKRWRVIICEIVTSWLTPFFELWRQPESGVNPFCSTGRAVDL